MMDSRNAFKWVQSLRKVLNFPGFLSSDLKCFRVFKMFSFRWSLPAPGVGGAYSYWYQSVSITISGRNTKLLNKYFESRPLRNCPYYCDYLLLDLTNKDPLLLKPMVDTREAQDKSPVGSSNNGASVGRNPNPPPPQAEAHVEMPPINPAQLDYSRCPENQVQADGEIKQEIM